LVCHIIAIIVLLDPPLVSSWCAENCIVFYDYYW